MTQETKPPCLSNRQSLDYVAESRKLTSWPVGLIDVHPHLHGRKAASVYAQAADVYGIGVIFSMAPYESVGDVKAVLGNRVRFIATPDLLAVVRFYALSKGDAQRLREVAGSGVRIAKFWSVPRGFDFADQAAAPPNLYRLDAPHVVANMDLPVELGMSIRVHVGAPDTWLATHYANTRRHGSKAAQHAPLQEALRRYPDVFFIAAHLGEWPENLELLNDSLQTHRNLVLDTSATKWMVRELSKIAPARVCNFSERWSSRLMFISDIVTRDGHLQSSHNDNEAPKARSEKEAFELYASRYWPLKTSFETDYCRPSPIADPDHHLVNPEHYAPDDAPEMHGLSLDSRIPRDIYRDHGARILLDGS